MSRDKRIDEISNLANTLDMKYAEKDEYGLSQQLRGFELFKREKSWFKNGEIKNLMTKQVGTTTFYLFDYEYAVSNGKSTSIVAQTVFFANDNTWSLPGFHIKPETIWHKLLEKFGAQDIDFEENKAFSDKFKLTGKMEDYIRATFSPALQDFLVSRPPAHIEADNYYLLVYKPGFKMNPEQVKYFFQFCQELVQHFNASKPAPILELAKLKETITQERT